MIILSASEAAGDVSKVSWVGMKQSTPPFALSRTPNAGAEAWMLRTAQCRRWRAAEVVYEVRMSPDSLWSWYLPAGSPKQHPTERRSMRGLKRIVGTIVENVRDFLLKRRLFACIYGAF
jgi:hypothetical protein